MGSENRDHGVYIGTSDTIEIYIPCDLRDINWSQFARDLLDQDLSGCFWGSLLTLRRTLRLISDLPRSLFWTPVATHTLRTANDRHDCICQASDDALYLNIFCHRFRLERHMLQFAITCHGRQFVGIKSQILLTSILPKSRCQYLTISFVVQLHKYCQCHGLGIFIYYLIRTMNCVVSLFISKISFVNTSN